MDPQLNGCAAAWIWKRDMITPYAGLLVALWVAFGSATIQATPSQAGQTVEPGTVDTTLRLPALTYPDVVALSTSGDYAAALASLDRAVGDTAPEPLDALVLRATLLNAAGRRAEAEAAWRQVIDREVWMRTFSRRALVASMAARGEPTLATPILSELHGSDPVRHLDLTLDVADAHLAREEFDRASVLFRQALSQQRRGAMADRARLGLARAQEGAGDLSGAIATLRETQLEHRTGAGYAEARSAGASETARYRLRSPPASTAR